MTIAFKEQKAELDELDASSSEDDELMTRPAFLRSEHAAWCLDDIDGSTGRNAVQELMDFVPPFDPAELKEMGMEHRSNINYGAAAATKNEAVGAYIDLYTATSSLSRIVLERDTHPELTVRQRWAAIMDQKWTDMFRSWDAGLPNAMLLADIYVTQGIAIPWFDDSSTIDFNVGSLEDCHFPSDCVAVPSKVPMMTMERSMTLTELHRKLGDSEDDSEDLDGWNREAVKNLITNACKEGDDDDGWNMEKIGRRAKANRTTLDSDVPQVTLIWGLVRELDGSFSIYCTEKNPGKAQDDDSPPRVNADGEDEVWLYRKHSHYKKATEAFQIFAFGVGNKNLIYTIRGLGYAIYESAQADNVLRCKLNDAAQHRAGEIYQPESTIDSVEDLQFIDLGFGIVQPKGLKGVPQFNQLRLDESIMPAIQSNREMINLHASGLSQNSLFANPTARRNREQVNAEIEATNKMASFAMTLFQTPWDGLITELIRRSFQETQNDKELAAMVEAMMQECEDEGVPREMFDKIDFRRTRATRLAGAGSKANRMLQYEKMATLYPNMDAIGQERFDFDYATEIQDAEKAEKYFGVPGERRTHIDVSIARSENNDLLEGMAMDPVDGENKMVHLEEHIAELTADMERVATGEVDLSEWTLRHLPLYEHTVATMELTTVAEQLEPRLNQYRQAIQQVGEQIENGLRHINKNQEANAEAAAAGGAEGDPAAAGAETPEQSAARKDIEQARAIEFGKAQAKIDANMAMAEQQRAEKVKDSIVNRQLKDAETAAEIRRQDAKAAGERSRPKQSPK